MIEKENEKIFLCAFKIVVPILMIKISILRYNER